MAKSLQIISDKQSEKVLNKEQRRFNSLVQKISTLREKIGIAKDMDQELRSIGEERVKPTVEIANTVCREWILALHHHPAKHKLSKKSAEKFPAVMLEEIEPFLQHHSNLEDTELQELYAQYEGSGRKYEEIRDEDEMEEKALAADMMNAVFGMDISPEDLDDPEKMQEKLRQKQAAFDADQQERQQNRKKSEAAKAAEEKRKAAQASVNKTAKQIYLDLVRNFHPDKELDEQKRVEKTEIMQQITEAYQADDHLRLLELQMNLLTSRNNVFADFDNAQLKYFNQTLQQQVFELEEELYFSSPEGSGNMYGHLYHPNRAQMQRNIEQYIRQIKQSTKGIRHNLSLIHDEKMFKEYIRDYRIEDFWGW